jgi:hypothetical protein
MALKNYNLLSFPDDEAIAVCVSALIWLQLGQPVLAKTEFDSITITSAKLNIYLEALKSCLAGTIPVLPTHHPLARAEWRRFLARSQSSIFKIIELLKSRPHSRDELIYLLWGPHATSESYCNRLYVTLNKIRKKNLAQIVFDGEKYEIK